MNHRHVGAGVTALLCVTLAAFAGDPIRGGRLWDTWWLELGDRPPAGMHPHASADTPAGSESFRCVQCHGWTGDSVAGVGAAAFGNAVEHTHGLGDLGLGQDDIDDLYAYVSASHTSAAMWLNADGQFTGDPVTGANLFRSGGGGLQCVSCHGTEGTWLNFGTPGAPQWLGTVAGEDPARLFHRIQFGMPGSVMPGWLRTGGDAQGAADLAAFAQQRLPATPADRATPAAYSVIPAEDPSSGLPPPITLSLAEPLGEQPVAGEHPLIAHVLPRDVDGDGVMDVLACDVARQQVVLLRQESGGRFTERAIGGPVPAPVHLDAADMDGDGDLDIVVSDMGVMLPSNESIGRVLVLEQQPDLDFEPHVLVDGIHRVTDARAGDLDGDGDLDLAVSQFGYVEGEVRWMENLGNWTFRSHHLMDRSGAIHGPLADLDADGDLDIVVLFSQEWETVQAFINDGHGTFTPIVLHDVADPDFSSSGIDVGDIDGDGDVDIAWANGDAFVSVGYRPLPSHGVQWLENLGDHQFAFHRLGHFDGAYGPTIVDLDGDGDMDIAAVSEFARWAEGSPPALRWWAQDEQGRFAAADLDTDPTHLVTLAAADLNADGRSDLIAGGMALYPPMDRVQRIAWWRNEGLGDPVEVRPGPSPLPPSVATAVQSAATPGQRGMLLHANAAGPSADADYAAAELADPQNAHWPYYRGLLDLEVGDAAAALDHFTRAATLDPSYPTLQVRLGELHFGRGDHSAAEMAWVAAGDVPEAIVGLATVAEARGEWDRVASLLAERDIPQAAALRARAQQAMGVDTVPPTAALDMGLQPEDPWQDAVLERCMLSDPLVNRAQIAFIRGDLDDAERWLRQAVDVAGDEIDPRLALGNLLLTPARATPASIAEALLLLNAAYAARPGDIEVRSRRAWALSLAGQAGEAMSEWMAIVQTFPRHAPSLFHIGQARAAAGDTAAALTYFRRGIAVPRDTAFSSSFEDPLRAHWLTQYASAAKAEGQIDEAIGAFGDVARILPNDPEAHFRYGNILLSRKRFDEALTHLQFAARHGEPSGRRHTAVGYALLQLQRYGEAGAALQQAVAMEPSFALGWFHLASAELRMGNRSAAIEALEQAIRIRPDFARARRALEALR